VADNGWYRRAKAAAQRRIRAGGVERDVVIWEAGPETASAVTDADHAKDDHYGRGVCPRWAFQAHPAVPGAAEQTDGRLESPEPRLFAGGQRDRR
jgi:hypothetical protein